jgi:FAD/FMN-containing dehydrogenase
MPGADDPLEGLPATFRGDRSSAPEVLEAVASDASMRRGRPSARVRPIDTEDVERLVRWARDRNRPLVVRGGGTSLNGESVPPDGAIVVDLSGWTSIGPVDPDRGTIEVGPGVVNRTLADRLRGSGWFFPPNPGSWRSSTIGGNVSTDASGPRSLKYGPTRRWVRELEAVLGSGVRVRAGTALPKRSVGPDLLGLLVGSEGTLGILTGIRLQLAPAPARRLGLAIPVAPGGSLARLARGLLRHRSELGLSALEYIDSGCATALSTVPGSRIAPGSALVLAEVESADPPAEARCLERWSEELGALGLTAEPSVYPDADHLWTMRGESGAILDERYGARVREDITVPIDRLDEMGRAIDRIAASAGVPVFLYGHLGEGNLHPNLVIDPGSPRAQAARAAILEEALRLGGSASGEHGIGSVKRAYLGREIGDPMVELLRAVKAACDPAGVLNPGKLLPDPPNGSTGRPGPSPGDGGAARTPPA